MTQKQLKLVDLEPNTTYVVQIRGVFNDEAGPYSTQIEFDSLSDTTSPGPVLNAAVEVKGPDFYITYDSPTVDEDGNALTDLRDIQVTIYPTGTPGNSRTIYTVDEALIFGFDLNKSTFTTPQPDLTFEFRARDRAGNLSDVVTVQAVNGAPSAFVLTAAPERQAIPLSWTDPGDGDIKEFDVFRDTVKIATVSGSTLSYNDADPGRGSHDYFIRARDVYNQTTDSNVDTESATGYWEDDNIAPASPTNLSLSSALDTNDETGATAYIEASFDAPTQNSDTSTYSDHEGFQVRWSRNAAGPFNYANVVDDRADGGTPQSFSFRIDALQTGQEYHVGVRAFDRYGNYSGWSTASITTAADTVAPAVPAGLSLNGGIETISASWTPNSESDLSHYEVYASTTSGFTPGSGNLKFSGLGTATSWPAAADETWFAVIRAVDRAGNTSAYSTEVSATAQGSAAGDDIPPANVDFPVGGLTGDTYFHGSSERAKITADWNAVADGDLAHYVLAWKDTDDTNWNEVLVGGESTAYTITGLDPNNTYEARLKAVDTSGNRSSAWSTTRQATVSSSSTSAPATVTGLSATANVGSVSFSWSANTDPDLNDYHLQIDDNSGFTSPIDIYVKSTNYEYTSAAGTTLYARVKARDVYGNESSSWSSTANATVLAAGSSDISDNAITETKISDGSISTPKIQSNAVTANEIAANTITGNEIQAGSITAADAVFDTAAIQSADINSLAATKLTAGTINTGDILVGSTLEINTLGEIVSENFSAVSGSEAGYRLNNTALEFYGGSIILGGSGLNINTDVDQLWFGATTFAAASWRVDSTGDMRVGTDDTDLHIDASGNIWSGAATHGTAPWKILATGEATFSHIHILGDNVAAGADLMNLNNKFILHKHAGGEWEVHLATDMAIDAGGNLQLNGGSITLTSGNFNMNGGTMNLAGGAVNFNGAPVTINGSDFTVTNGDIVLNGGSIQSNNYDGTGSGDGSQGFYMDNTFGLEVSTGVIRASALEIQDSPNLIDMAYADFEQPNSWYQSRTTSDTGITTTVSSGNSRYRNQSLEVASTAGAMAGTWLGASDVDYNIPVDPSTTYIFSAYVYSVGTDTVQLSVKENGTGTPTSVVVTEPTDASAWKRIWGTFTTLADTTSVILKLEVNATYTALFDGLQLEEKVSNINTPSFFKVGGMTTIDGGSIITGSIESTNFVTGSGGSGWRLGLDGSLEANDGTFRGTIEGAVIDIGGADASSFHIDSSGNMWLGASTFASAPFKVSSSGSLTASSGTFSGDLDIQDSVNGVTIRTLISDGRVRLFRSGSIVGTIAPDNSVSGTFLGMAYGDWIPDQTVPDNGYVYVWSGGANIGAGSTLAEMSFDQNSINASASAGYILDGGTVTINNKLFATRVEATESGGAGPGAPAYTFTGRTDSGLYFEGRGVGDDGPAFSMGGTRIVRFHKESANVTRINLGEDANDYIEFDHLNERFFVFVDSAQAFQVRTNLGVMPPVYNVTTAQGANMHISSSGTLFRSTSSKKYKKQIEDADPELLAKVLELRPVWYKSKAGRDRDDWSWWGLIAEEVAEIDPRWVIWEPDYDHPDGPDEQLDVDEEVGYNGPMRPAGVAYERLTPAFISVLNSLVDRIEAIEKKIGE